MTTADPLAEFTYFHLMLRQPIGHTFKRFQTLYTHRIGTLPVVILMPHSACNCRCVMCDIWKDNKNLKQLTESDIEDLLTSLKALETKVVVMSGGEALLNHRFFNLCEILKRQKLHITLLSTGLLLKKHAENIVKLVDEVIISLDGDETTHDRIRNIPGCFQSMQDGIDAIRHIDPSYRITARSVIHRLNFRVWPGIIASAKALALHQVSFLPADVSSTAFNRDIQWDTERQEEVMLTKDELPMLSEVIDHLVSTFKNEFDTGFIAESPSKLKKIYQHYAALHGIEPFPAKKCNAPWVSAVIESDGAVKPCFFHEAIGNIRAGRLENLLNKPSSVAFRKYLDLEKNETCRKCVCYLNLSATTNPASL